MNELETSTLQHYLGVLWRRRLYVLAPLVVAAVAGFVAAHRQAPVYEASAQVLLNHEDQVATSLVGVQTPVEDPGRFAVTQSIVAWTPELARRVLAAVGDAGGDPTNLLHHTNVEPNADVLVFTVRNRDASKTVRLADAWARQFTAYRRTLDTRELASTLSQLEQRIAGLRGTRGAEARLATALAAKAQDVRLLEALRKSNVYVIRTASAGDADKVAPRPTHTTAIAAAVGLLLGLLAAFLRESFDTRIRSAPELEDALGLPLLGRLPAGAGEATAEAALTLATRLARALPDPAGRTVLVAGAAEDGGAAAAAAELARASARSGRDVALVDLDLRSAPLDLLLPGAAHRPGIAAAAAGEADLASILTPVALDAAAGGGRLRVVAAGPAPRGRALAASAAVAATLHALRDHVDEIVAVAPPVLAFADALAAAPAADGTVLALPGEGVRRVDVQDVVRLAGDWPTPLLGFVLVDRARRRPGPRLTVRPPAGTPTTGDPAEHPAESAR